MNRNGGRRMKRGGKGEEWTINEGQEDEEEE